MIHLFDLAALLRRHVQHVHVAPLRRHRPEHVAGAVEHRDEAGVARQVRDDAQFELRVIRRHQHAPWCQKSTITGRDTFTLGSEQKYSCENFTRCLVTTAVQYSPQTFSPKKCVGPKKTNRCAPQQISLCLRPLIFFARYRHLKFFLSCPKEDQFQSFHPRVIIKLGGARRGKGPHNGTKLHTAQNTFQKLQGSHHGTAQMRVSCSLRQIHHRGSLLHLSEASKQETRHVTQAENVFTGQTGAIS